MERTFNAIEVFEIAEQIERNGVAFYRRASEFFKDADVARIFAKLAEWEVEHEAVMAGMRRQMAADAATVTFNLDDPPLDAAGLAGLAAFGFSPEDAARLTGTETESDVLRLALQNEEESVVYYTILRKFIADDLAGKKIDAILAEEQHHIDMLRQALAEREPPRLASR